MTTNNIKTFCFPVCTFCRAADDGCGWCMGIGLEPLTKDPQATDEEAFIAFSWPPPAEQPEDPGSGVYFRDSKDRIKHIAAA